MKKCRIIFMGSPEFAVPTLVALTEATSLCEVVGVVSQPDRPAGRGRKVTAAAVKLEAIRQGLPTFTPTKMKSPETRETLAKLNPDLLVVAAYGRILPPALLDLGRIDAINVHASLLPRHRGASPIAHMIMEGDSEVGVSIMRMEEGLDTGPVFASEARAARPDDTLANLTEELAHTGARLLCKSLPGIVDGSLVPSTQNGDGATYAPLLRKSDGWLDFESDATVLERRVRGLSPWPGTFTMRGEERVAIFAACVVGEADDAHAEAHSLARESAPGTVIGANRQGVLVACGADALMLQEVRPAGRKVMPAAAWVAGRGVAVGDRFDSPQRVTE